MIDATRCLETARTVMRDLTVDVGDEGFRTQYHADFSPIGWHYGHVAWQEEVWLLRNVAGQMPIDPALDHLFDSFVSPKGSRGRRLPSRAEVNAYQDEVRARVRELIEKSSGDFPKMRELVRFLANHEQQHAEIVTTVRLLGGLVRDTPDEASSSLPSAQLSASDFVAIPGGTFVLGVDDDPDGWDNERSAHVVSVESFQLASHPVTELEWIEFIEFGGYERREFWSDEGYSWLCTTGATGPLHFRKSERTYESLSLAGWTTVGARPVAHVSFFEAEAYARFVGARLPTEAEWEYAASWDAEERTKRRFPWSDANGAPSADSNSRASSFEEVADLLRPFGRPLHVGRCPRGGTRHGVFELAGGVWEWVGSHFEPYPGFRPQDYEGYSQPWFGKLHRCARGGSRYSAPPMARAAFRNWYEPRLREPCLGVRLARDAAS